MRTYEQARTSVAVAPGRANHARRTPEPFLHVLQRAAGNRAVGGYLQHSTKRAADSVLQVDEEPESGGADGDFESTARHGLASPTAVSGGGFAGLGLTTAPSGYKAPQFEFGTVAAMGATAADPPTFTCTPTWKEHMDEGTNVCWYLAAGKHKSITPSGGKDVFIKMSAAWHTFDVTGPPAVTATEIMHTVAAGSTSLGATSSADLIV